MGAIAIADLVKTTLGPKGMDKILQSVRIIKKILKIILYVYFNIIYGH